ncbi:hypothetical protein ACFX2H_015354 [Malus domestica]
MGVLESFSVTGSPLKHTDSSLEAPPNALQKLDFDCQSSVSSLALFLAGTPPNEGAKGEFKIDTFWHVSHTSEQKLVTASLAWDEFDETVELQRTGTRRGTESTVKSSPELCDRRMPLKLKGKFYRTAIRPAMLYGTECWAVKHQHVHKMGVAEMRMLRWMCGHTRKDKIRNEDIRGKVGVAEIEGKMRENRLRWFGHVQRRPTDAPIRRCDYGTEVQGRRGRGRPRKTLEETLRKDLEYLDLTKDMTQDRAQWRSKIHIADPTQ